MSLSVELGLVLALLTAFGSVAGFLYKFRGAREAPEVELRRPLHSTVELFRSPLYVVGIAIALSSWGFHVAALSLAPISLVQSVIAGGLVLLTVVADRLFGIEVTRREWVGVGLTAAGLAFLAATLDGGAGSAHSRYDPSTLAIFVSIVGGCGLALALRPRRAALLAVSAGLLWAASDTSIKALSSHLGALGLGVLAGRVAGLRAQPAARRRGPDDRADQRLGQPDHDRRRPNRLLRVAARRPPRAGRARAGLRAGDRGRSSDAAAGGRPPLESVGVAAASRP
jgi:drug/metabolite transporter (DMT)-like permease